MSNRCPHFRGDGKITTDESGFTIKPRGLNIIWGNNRSYWRLPNKDTDDPLELIQVCWLEVTSSIDLSKLSVGKYRISFKINMKPNAFGWNGNPIRLTAKIGKNGKYNKKNWDVAGFNSELKTISLEEPLEIVESHRRSGDKLYFGLYEIWSGKWKGGLLVHEAKVSPV